MNFRMLLCKVLQRQTYSCLSTRSGIWFALFGLCVVIVAVLHFGEVALQWSMVRYAGHFHVSRYYDNIGGKSFEPRLCLPQPIDIVYTWVNGSDPALVKNLNEIKKKIEIELNRTSSNEFEAKKKRGKLINDETFKWKVADKCPFPNCVPANRIAVSGLHRSISIYMLRSVNSFFKEAQSMEFWDEDSDIAFLSFKSQKTVSQILNVTCRYKNKPLNISEVFFTSTIKLGHKRLENSLMLHEFLNHSETEIKSIVNIKIENAVNDVRLYPEEDIAVVSFPSKDFTDRIKKLFLKGEPLRFFPVTFVWKPVSLSIDNSDSDFSSNRFADNSELKFSLRSVDKFVPWVRKIFIVTNGQIPNWLDLNHPRIKLVTHQEIFTNQSHLPTFSSPAIESHIHRIPGLSKKFIYMNDDVFFGAPVWPDDFFTHSQGQKIYLSWAVPNCNEGCPASWINDKYCDKACNVSACDYDGGDCLGSQANKKGGSWALQNTAQRFANSRMSEYCFPGCAINWVGDRYCDGNCNHKECAFDGGDCGVQNFNMLFSYTLDKGVFKGANNFIVAPEGTLAMYVNLTNIFDSLIEGTFSDTPVLRNAILSKKFKVLTMTFFKNLTESTVDFQILGYKGINKTDKSVAMFQINVTTLVSTTPAPLKSETNTTEEVIPKEVYKNQHKLPTGEHVLSINSTSNSIVVNFPEEFLNQSLPENLSQRRAEIYQELADGELTGFGFNRSMGMLYQQLLEYDFKKVQTGRKLLWVQEDQDESTRNKNRQAPPAYSCLTDPECILSFLPWEQGRYGMEAAKKTKRLDTLQSYAVSTSSSKSDVTRRRLFDAYSSSLLHVSRIYNKAFGYIARKVPAHMPHMVDRDIIYEMQTRFLPYFEATSSHRLRHPQDMQFAFSYNYYVDGVKKSKNLEDVFSEIDTDQSGVLDDRELRTLTAILYTLPITTNDINRVENNLKNCSRRLKQSRSSTNGSASKPTENHETGNGVIMPLVTRKLFVNCHEVWKQLNKTAGAKYPHELAGEDDLAFQMIANNVSVVQNQLDWIRKNSRKFVCINDDIDHDRADAKQVRKVLKEFYESMFPMPSQFELKSNLRNRFLYKHELDEWIQSSKMFSQEIHFLATTLVLALGFYFLRHKIFICCRLVFKFVFARDQRLNEDFVI